MCGAFPPESLSNVSIMKTEVSSFLDQFVYCVPSCSRDLMPFSPFVGGNAIISLAPASWQAGPSGRSCAYQLSTHCHSDRNVGTRRQMKSGMSSAGLRCDAAADDTLHYVAPAGCCRSLSSITYHTYLTNTRETTKKQQHVLTDCDECQ